MKNINGYAVSSPQKNILSINSFGVSSANCAYLRLLRVWSTPISNFSNNMINSSLIAQIWRTYKLI